MPNPSILFPPNICFLISLNKQICSLFWHIVYQYYSTHFAPESQLLFCLQMTIIFPSPLEGFLVMFAEEPKFGRNVDEFAGNAPALQVKFCGSLVSPVPCSAQHLVSCQKQASKFCKNHFFKPLYPDESCAIMNLNYANDSRNVNEHQFHHHRQQ